MADRFESARETPSSKGFFELKVKKKGGAAAKLRRKAVSLLVLVFCGAAIIGAPGSYGVADSIIYADSPAELSIWVGYPGHDATPFKTYTEAEFRSLGMTEQAFLWRKGGVPVIHATRGISVRELLQRSGIDTAAILHCQMYSTDNLYPAYTPEQLFSTPRYYYPRYIETFDYSKMQPGIGAADNAVSVEVMLAVDDYFTVATTPDLAVPRWDLMSSVNRFRLVFGQESISIGQNSLQQTIKYIYRIVVTVPEPPPRQDGNTEEVIVPDPDGKGEGSGKGSGGGSGDGFGSGQGAGSGAGSGPGSAVSGSQSSTSAQVPGFGSVSSGEATITGNMLAKGKEISLMGIMGGGASGGDGKPWTIYEITEAVMPLTSPETDNGPVNILALIALLATFAMGAASRAATVFIGGKADARFVKIIDSIRRTRRRTI